MEPIRNAGHVVRTLNDFLTKTDRESLANPDWIGMIEQVVASNGRVFIGTYWSTFTGYIMRMRGYKVDEHIFHYSLSNVLFFYIFYRV